MFAECYFRCSLEQVIHIAGQADHGSCSVVVSSSQTPAPSGFLTLSVTVNPSLLTELRQEKSRVEQRLVTLGPTWYSTHVNWCCSSGLARPQVMWAKYQALRRVRRLSQYKNERSGPLCSKPVIAYRRVGRLFCGRAGVVDRVMSTSPPSPPPQHGHGLDLSDLYWRQTWTEILTIVSHPG